VSDRNDDAPYTDDEVMDMIDPYGIVRAKAQANAAVDLAELEAKAKAAKDALDEWDGDDFALLANCEKWKPIVDDYTDATDPSAVLAVIARCRDAEERAELAELRAATATMAANAAEAEAQALRTALEAMVGLAYENTTHSILPEWQCRYCIRRNRAESLVVHRDGCPVPAADNALALGAKGEKP